MVLRELKRRMNGGWKPVSVKYIILSSFKGVILLSQITFKTKILLSWYSLDPFTMPLYLNKLHFILLSLVLFVNVRQDTFCNL